MLLEELTKTPDTLRAQLKAAQAELASATKQSSAVYHDGASNLPMIAKLQDRVTKLQNQIRQDKIARDKAAALTAAHSKIGALDPFYHEVLPDNKK